MATTTDDFDFLYHNIIFPPRLPQAEDKNELSKQRALVELVARSSSDYAGLAGQSKTQLWYHLKRTLKWLQEIYISGVVIETKLPYAFRSMVIGGK